MPFTPLVSDYIYVPVSMALIAAAVSIYTDIRWGLIKNFVTFPLILFGLTWSLVLGGLEIFLINLALAVVIGFASRLGGQLGAGDVKLIAGIAACLQPMLNVLFLAFFFVTLLAGAILIRLKIHRFKLMPALCAMRNEVFMELGGVRMAGYLSHGDGIKHLGAPIIFAALVFTLIRAYTGGFLL